MFDEVKRCDEAFKPHEVNERLLNQDGTPKVYYGSVEQMEGEYGRGFYFTSGKSDVKSEPVYLKVENAMLPEEGADETKEYDRIITQTQAVVFKRNQIKSATENAGSFNAENSDIRYSLSDRYSYDTLTSKPDIQVTQIDTSRNMTRDESVQLARENVQKYAQRADITGAPMLYVNDLGKYVVIGKKGLTHGLDRRTNLQAPVIARIGDILTNSVVVNEADPKKDGVRNSYILLGAARTSDGELVLVSSVVNQSSGHLEEVGALYAVLGKKNRTSRNISAERVKAGAFQPYSGSEEISRVNATQTWQNAEVLPSDLGGTGHVSERRLGESLGAASNSNISIAELLENVNGLFDDVISNRTLDQSDVIKGSVLLNRMYAQIFLLLQQPL